MTTERPILFNGTMVRAILSGAKTVTRRPISPQPAFEQFYEWRGKTLYEGSGRRWFFRQHYLGEVCCNQPDFSETLVPFCPLGAPGDRLWVRESWCAADTMYYEHDQSPPRVVGYLADRSALSFEDAFDGRKPRVIPAFDREQWNWKRLRGRPSIHMPRWASRLSLDVVSVGVERVQDIDDEGATREGIQWWSKDGALRKYAPADDEGDGPMWPWRDCPRSPREAFERLWTEVYGAPSWAANPWVWRVEFVRVEGGR